MSLELGHVHVPHLRITIYLFQSKLLMDDSFSKTLLGGSTKVSFEPDRPVSCWEENIDVGRQEQDTFLICVAPNLVCTSVYQTAGGGDNISAAGLAAQV